MLNTFPELLNFSFVAITFLRVVAGLIFVYFGWLKLTKDKEVKIRFFEEAGFKPAIFWLYLIAFVEIIVGVMIVVGFLTQIASMIASLIMFASIIIKLWKPSSLPNTTDFYILFFVVFFYLMFTGAGAFAFDMPL